MRLPFIPISEIEGFSERWLRHKIRACEVFAVKINGRWYVPEPELRKLLKNKKTHRKKLRA